MTREIWTAPRGKSHIVDNDTFPTVLCGAGGFITVGPRWVRNGKVDRWFDDRLWMEGERCKHCDALGGIKDGYLSVSVYDDNGRAFTNYLRKVDHYTIGDKK